MINFIIVAGNGKVFTVAGSFKNIVGPTAKAAAGRRPGFGSGVCKFKIANDDISGRA
jgi:hypothetical protein